MNHKYENLKDITVKFALISAAPPQDEFPFAMQIFSEDKNQLDTTAAKIHAFIEGKDIGNGVKVSDVVYDQTGTITAIDGKRYISLKAKFTGEADTNSVLQVKDIIEKEFTTSKLKDLGLSGATLGFDFGGESENLQSFYSTIFAFVAALAILYGLLVFKFNSFLQPILVFLAIPLSFPLVFPGLYITNNSLSFFVMIGLIGLVGIVVNNTVMLVDFANQGRKSGLTIRKSIVNAVRLRFRPLVVTSLTTIAGLLPLALQDPVWESLAFTIIFGLISSTLLVLFIFPAFYAIVEKIRQLKFKILPSLKQYEEESAE
jgi:multidrug efflux pump subunit AcrB